MSEYRKFGNDRGGRGFGGKSFGKPRFGGGGSFSRGRDDRPKQMFSATCAKCHKPCEVPFRPNGKKPVYCNECFSNQNEGSFSNNNDRRDSAPSYAPRPVNVERENSYNEQFETLARKLDKIINILESEMAEDVPVDASASIQADIKKASTKKEKKVTKTKASKKK